LVGLHSIRLEPTPATRVEHAPDAMKRRMEAFAKS
jgi:hypothetical protein